MIPKIKVFEIVSKHSIQSGKIHKLSNPKNKITNFTNYTSRIHFWVLFRSWNTMKALTIVIVSTKKYKTHWSNSGHINYLNPSLPPLQFSKERSSFHSPSLQLNSMKAPWQKPPQPHTNTHTWPLRWPCHCVYSKLNQSWVYTTKDPAAFVF